MLELAPIEIFYFFAAAAIVGFTKTSVGGMGILAVLLVALAFPGKASPGVLLPMLIIADIMAVIYYRRDCNWDIILKLAPMTIAGIVIGYFIVDIIPIDIFEKLLGLIILAMLAFGMFMERTSFKPINSKPLTYITGILAGSASMIANAAGPIFGVFLLQMGLKKENFVGTRSWFFLLINIIKVPFSVNLGLITADSLKLNFIAIPVILLGAFIGVKVLKMINMAIFKWLIRAAIIIAAFRLLLF